MADPRKRTASQSRIAWTLKLATRVSAKTLASLQIPVIPRPNVTQWLIDLFARVRKDTKEILPLNASRLNHHVRPSNVIYELEITISPRVNVINNAGFVSCHVTILSTKTKQIRTTRARCDLLTRITNAVTF